MTRKAIISDNSSNDISLFLILHQIEKGDFEYFMLKEIYEQPDSIFNSIRGRINYKNNSIKLGGINDWVNSINDANMVYITACGTSWHAALIGSIILEEVLNIPVKVEYASELRYRDVPINSKSAVIAISQSGETADTLAAIKKCSYTAGPNLPAPNFGLKQTTTALKFDTFPEAHIKAVF